jgi:transposase
VVPKKGHLEMTVGIDPHKHVHVAVAIDAAGRRVGRPLTVKNSPHLITGLLTWIRSMGDDTPVTWAIEDGHGFARRLADGLKRPRFDAAPV